ncbi:hypothetical protein DFH06DRAFT_1445494 [Mycena polygramma]|nr:hypothetical protein DFH06DRAFT_1445494 [Mycena polygramma]
MSLLWGTGPCYVVAAARITVREEMFGGLQSPLHQLGISLDSEPKRQSSSIFIIASLFPYNIPLIYDNAESHPSEVPFPRGSALARAEPRDVGSLRLDLETATTLHEASSLLREVSTTKLWDTWREDQKDSPALDALTLERREAPEVRQTRSSLGALLEVEPRERREERRRAQIEGLRNSDGRRWVAKKRALGRSSESSNSNKHWIKHMSVSPFLHAAAALCGSGRTVKSGQEAVTCHGLGAGGQCDSPFHGVAGVGQLTLSQRSRGALPRMVPGTETHRTQSPRLQQNRLNLSATEALSGVVVGER